MSQEIIFTVLPHKREEREGEPFLKLSVFVSVKLTTPNDTTLKKFNNILNWPAIIKEADFKFRLKDGTVLDADFNRDLIDEELFGNLFHEDIRVDDFKDEDLSTKRIFSVPVKHINDFVLNNYKIAAIDSPQQLLSAEKFVDDKRYGAISRYKLESKNIQKISYPSTTKRKTAPLKKSDLMRKDDTEDTDFRSRLKDSKFNRFEKKMNPKSDFVQLRQFHRMDSKLREGVSIKINKPEFEFHDIMAVVNSYPQIMRKLGFILDFTIPYNSTIASSGSIKLIPETLELDEKGTTVSLPVTAYKITAGGFYVADKPSSVFKKGFVKINSDEFTVVQIDVDGAALKTNNMAENKVQQIATFYESKLELEKSITLKKRNLQFVEPPEDEGLPYMRSAGIAVVKNGMAEHLTASIDTNYKLRSIFLNTKTQKLKIQKKAMPGKTPVMAQLLVKEPAVLLYSTDVVQGYRMDIAYEDEPDKWYSLHQRHDNYTWYDEHNNPTTIEGIVPDEGFIQLGMAEDPDDPDDVFVSETLARWEGWSLSVRKPGYAINEAEDYELKDGESVKRDFVHKSKAREIKKYAFDPDLEFRINAQSKIVPGTLPKLRFGKNYRVRVRTVDLAGNSVSLESQTESPAETTRSNIRYMRYEPLASPIVLVGNELKDGEFLERMVIRSNYDQSVSEYENTHALQGLTFNDFSRRYLLPPKNSQLMAENHGMFEQAFGNNPQAAKEIYNIITSHEDLYSQDEKNKEKIYQPSDVEIIYLPDPMAAGVSLFVAEGYENTHTQDFEPRMFGFFTNKEVQPQNTNVNIPADWYKAGVVTIKLEEGEYGGKWDKSSRTFTVTLPKGYRTRIKFSTFWREEDMKQLSAVWQMVKDDSPGNLKKIEDLAIRGQHWMVSPSREIELVHAVQQPIEQPVIMALLPDRDYDKTFVEINTRFDIHGQSTEKVEFQAKWTDPHDDGISVSIKEKQGRNSIPDIEIHYHDDKVTKGTIPEPIHLIDPARVQLQIKPQSKFKYITEDTFIKEPQPGAIRMNALYKPQAVKYREIEKKKSASKFNMVENLKMDIDLCKLSFVQLVNLRMKPLQHNFGDTKHRWVDYKLIATSRYGDYFDKVLAANPELNSNRESEWVEKVNILSSARPKAPEIDYVIPIFEWHKSQNGNSFIHSRKGGGLRIFIKRPWFSTGADEKLAVLLPHKSDPGIFSMVAMPTGYSKYYTHWGIDPILFSNKPGGFSPDVNTFGMNPHVDEVEHPDRRGGKTTAVAYPVEFDEERQLWFCDLAISPGTMYFPFVKLALARYQEHSVRKNGQDVCLSPMVMSTMIQLMPDRKTTLSFKKDDKNSKLTITVSGPIYNERSVKYGNYTSIHISFLDTRIVQPITGVVDDGTTDKSLKDEGFVINISQRNITNNIFSISKDFHLPGKYKKDPFQVVIEEYEHGPNKMPMQGNYNDRLEQSEETDRLIYADVFKVNEISR